MRTRHRRFEDSAPLGTSPRLRDQPALTTSSGKSWLVLAGLLSLISTAMLVPMTWLPPVGVAATGLVLVIVLYGLMLIVHAILPPGRRMLALLAAGMLAIAVVALGCVALVAATAWDVPA